MRLHADSCNDHRTLRISTSKMISQLLFGATLFAAAKSTLATNSSISRPGVDCACSALLRKNPSSVLLPASATFEAQTKHFWDVRSAVIPSCMVFPSDVDEVSEALTVLASCNAQFAVRGGGHMNVSFYSIAGPNSVLTKNSIRGRTTSRVAFYWHLIT